MCGRLILAPAATVPTKNGPMGYGPVCAKRAGLSAPRKASSHVPVRPVHQCRDAVTLDMFEGVAA